MNANNINFIAAKDLRKISEENIPNRSFDILEKLNSKIIERAKQGYFFYKGTFADLLNEPAVVLNDYEKTILINELNKKGYNGEFSFTNIDITW